MAQPRDERKPEDESLREIEDQPVTGETVNQGDKQETPTGREWDAERGPDLRDEDLESLDTEDVVFGERVPRPQGGPE